MKRPQVEPGEWLVPSNMSPNATCFDVPDGGGRDCVTLCQSNLGVWGLAYLKNLAICKFSRRVGHAFFAPLVTISPTSRPHVLHVSLLGPWINMGRIAAWRVITLMQCFKAVFKPMNDFANDTMNIKSFQIPSQLPVSTIIGSTNPWPTFVAGFDIYPRKHRAVERAVGLMPPLFRELKGTSRAVFNRVGFGHSRTIAQEVCK